MLPCKAQLSTNTQSLGRWKDAGKPEVNTSQRPEIFGQTKYKLTKIYHFFLSEWLVQELKDFLNQQRDLPNPSLLC